MKRRLLTVVAFLSLASAAWAVPIDPAPDGIGIYFDPGGTISCGEPVLYQELVAYILITNPTHAGIIGFEATILIWPSDLANLIFANCDVGPNGLNVDSFPVLFVGYRLPLAGNPALVATLRSFYLGGPVLYGIGPSPARYDGLTGYAIGDGSSLVPLTPSSNVPWTLPAYNVPTVPAQSYVVAGVQGSNCPVAAEPTSWGAVKALYSR